MSGLLVGLRFAGLLLAGGSFYYAISTFEQTRLDLPGWYFLGACLALCVLWQWRVDTRRPAEPLRSVEPGTWIRVSLGLALAIVGAGAFVWASAELYGDWQGSFDKSWLTWIGATTAIGVGLDVAWGRWPRPSGLWSRTDLALAMALFGLGAALRAYGLVEFPGPFHVSQIEEAQIGKYGYRYIVGDRIRWEFLSHMWLSALGQSLFSNDLVSVRIPFAVVNAAKLIPFYFWLRWLVGRPGAVVATALLACSGWDVMLSRIPTNQNELTAAVSFALLAGPARRGRPSAYVFLGLIGGYVSYEYIAYRPLTVFILVGATGLSLVDRSVGWGRRLFRPLVTLAIAALVAVPLMTGKLANRISSEYLNGWNRAYAQRYYSENTDRAGLLEKRVQRSRDAVGSLFFKGDSATVRNLDRRPALDPVTGAFLIAGVGYALSHWVWGLVPLSLVAFLVTFTGTLIATGNFDMARAGCNVVYVHALAGFGAAGLIALLRLLPLPRLLGSMAVVGSLSVLVAGAAYSNLDFLNSYWHSPKVRRAQHLELAYQTLWLDQNVRSDEKIIGLSARVYNVLLQHDASWIGSGRLEGEVFADLMSMLDEIEASSGQALALFVAAEAAGPAAVDYLSSIWPQLAFEYTEHPEWPGNGFYMAHVSADQPLESDTERLALARCRSPLGEFIVHFREDDDVRIPTRFPFVDRSTWPHRVRTTVSRRQGLVKNVTVRVRIPFSVEQRGVYLFRTVLREGTTMLSVGDKSMPGRSGLSVELEAGTHELRVTGDFLPTAYEAEMRLEWRRPGFDREYELMPIYRLPPPPTDLGCNNVGLSDGPER